MPSRKVSERLAFLGQCPFFNGNGIFKEGDSVNE